MRGYDGVLKCTIMYDKTYRIFIVFGYLGAKRMGGRYYPNRKSTVEASCRISIQYLKKQGLLSGRHSTTMLWTTSLSKKTTTVRMDVDITDEPYIRLYYTTIDRDGAKTDYDYEVSLSTTPCYFGGVRYWFWCPLCYSRVGALYLPRGHVRFRCRHCNDLSYYSRNESSPLAKLGETDREIKRLRSEIKRWTWGGLPTRKVRKLRRLERKVGIFGSMAMQSLNKLNARILRR